VINVDLLSVIRRWHHREKLAIREIALRTGLSRNTIRKYLAGDTVEPKYPNQKQLYRDLASLGYAGSYDRVAAFARDWRQREREAAHRAGRGTYFPLQFDPGEAFQFDWSEDWVRIGFRSVKLQIAHFKLSHSRAFMLRAYPQQTHEILFDAHNHCLAALGEIPERGIYDKMKTAVDQVGRGKQRKVNARFRAMVSHFLFNADFCNPPPAGRRVRLRRTCAMPGIASGRRNPGSTIWPP
jgi:transposase